jgi:hypothetical protein
MSPVDDHGRVVAIGRLHDLVGQGELSLDAFALALERMLSATDEDELADVMAAVPPLVRLTPRDRRLMQPLTVNAGSDRVELGVGWQLGQRTTVKTVGGSCLVDLSAVTWDAHEIDLTLRTCSGVIEVLVPRGVAVQIVSASGAVCVDGIGAAWPGAPMVRISATATGGRIRIAHHRRRGRKQRRW